MSWRNLVTFSLKWVKYEELSCHRDMFNFKYSFNLKIQQSVVEYEEEYGAVQHGFLEYIKFTVNIILWTEIYQLLKKVFIWGLIAV